MVKTAPALQESRVCRIAARQGDEHAVVISVETNGAVPNADPSRRQHCLLVARLSIGPSASGEESLASCIGSAVQSNPCSWLWSAEKSASEASDVENPSIDPSSLSKLIRACCCFKRHASCLIFKSLARGAIRVAAGCPVSAKSAARSPHKGAEDDPNLHASRAFRRCAREKPGGEPNTFFS